LKIEPNSVQDYYANYYSRMMGKEAKGILKYLWVYPHRLMSKASKKSKYSKIIEVGAGQGEHLYAVGNLIDCDFYTVVDIDGQRLKLIPEHSKFQIIRLVSDAVSTGLNGGEYDKLIATCLLAHLPEPETALNEWRRMVKNGGELILYIPCEPGIALMIFRKLITEKKAKKLGFEGFKLLIARDHANSADRLLTLIKHVFRNDRIDFLYRPFIFHSWYLNLFIVVKIEKNIHE